MKVCLLKKQNKQYSPPLSVSQLFRMDYITYPPQLNFITKQIETFNPVHLTESSILVTCNKCISKKHKITAINPINRPFLPMLNLLMKKNVFNLFLILALIFGCQSKNENKNSDSYILKADENTEYIIFGSNALSSDGKEIAFNVAFQMKILSDYKNQSTMQDSDLKYYTKAAVTSLTRSLIGTKSKEELSDIKMLNSDIPESDIPEEITETMHNINSMLNDVGTKVTSLIITIQK